MHHLEGNERVRFISGDILDVEAFRKAYVPNCDVFVAATDIDDCNLVACFSAKILFLI
jgi:Trk K+ transport system NAD-binding subunit